MIKTLIATIVILSTTTAASAFCKFGPQYRAGSLGPGQVDNSRFYTLSGFANLVISVRKGGPITANLGCGWSTSRYHSCSLERWGRAYARLRNNTGRQITYSWGCEN